MNVAPMVADHYSGNDLARRVSDALASLGDLRPSQVELAPLDQFHVRGLAATKELAEAAGVAEHMAVLDVGSGLGGPARYLAATFGCRVTGIDLSPAFVETARLLTTRTGLDSLVTFEAGNALALPFEDERFDLAWTQHVAMNIADRAGLYAGMARVLKRGGRLAIYDVVEGEQGPLHYPVPWARRMETSFLLTAMAMRRELERAGFRIVHWSDCTALGAAWFAEQQARPPAPARALGLPLAMGPDFPAMAANLGRNLREHRVGLIQAVLERA